LTEQDENLQSSKKCQLEHFGKLEIEGLTDSGEEDDDEMHEVGDHKKEALSLGTAVHARGDETHPPNLPKTV